MVNIKRVMQEIEVLDVTDNEYQDLNDLYKISLYNDGVPLPIVKTSNITRIILTDGIYRKEFHINKLENVGERDQKIKEMKEKLKGLIEETEHSDIYDKVYKK